MPVIIILALIAWFIFGDPQKQVADTFFKDGPAPWERVDAYYYPDRSDLSVWRVASDLPSIEQCRSFVFSEAALRNDVDLLRGDYECGVGKTDTLADLNVYRLTVQ